MLDVNDCCPLNTGQLSECLTACFWAFEEGESQESELVSYWMLTSGQPHSPSSGRIPWSREKDDRAVPALTKELIKSWTVTSSVCCNVISTFAARLVLFAARLVPFAARLVLFAARLVPFAARSVPFAARLVPFAARLVTICGKVSAICRKVSNYLRQS